MRETRATRSRLLPWNVFVRRLIAHAMLAGAILLGSLAIGVAGYRFAGGLGWLDSLLNASMILGGMGPVDRIETTAGKVFASFYALYSGVVFLVVASLLVSPIAHRIFHAMHLEGESRDDPIAKA